jgi:chromosome segregation ATPase
VRAKLAEATRNFNVLRKEFDVRSSDLDHSRAELAAESEELKEYRSALSGRTAELNATRSELQAVKTLRSADAKAAMSELKELEEMKAKLRVDNVEFINMRTALELKESALRKANDSASVATSALRTANHNLLLETSKVQELLSAKKQLVMLKMTEASQLEEMRAKYDSAQQIAAAAEESAKAENARADRIDAELQYAIHTAQQKLTEKQQEIDQLKSRMGPETAQKAQVDEAHAAEEEKAAVVRAQQAESKAQQAEFKLQYGISQAQQLIFDKQSEINLLHKNLINDVADIRRAITQMRADNATKHALGAMVATLRATLAKRDALLEKLQLRVENSTHTLAEHDALLEKMRLRVQNSTDTLAERDALLEKLRLRAHNSTDVASMQSEVEKFRGELMFVRAREIAAEQRADDDDERVRKLESQLASATMTVAQDAKLLKASKDSKQRLKDKIKAKYHKMVTKLKDVEAQNKALSQHVADLEGSK